MSAQFSTRRYFLIPLLPLGAKVEFDGRSLLVHKWFGHPRRIPLHDVSSEPVRGGVTIGGVMNRLFGCGSLTLTGGAVDGTVTICNLYNIRGLEAAIAGQMDLAGSAPPGAHVEQPSEARVLSVHHVSDDELSRHQAEFRALLAAPQPDAASTAPAPTRVELVHAWDGSHAVPKRGDGQRSNPPTVLQWASDGAELAVAGDPFGSTRWTVQGKRIGGGSVPAAWGHATRIFISGDGGYSLIEGHTGTHHVTIQDRAGEHRTNFPFGGSLWGRDDSPTAEGLDRSRWFSPWRPAASQLVVSRNSESLEFFDVRHLVAMRPGKKLPDAAVRLTIDFSVPDLETLIARYHLHPGGRHVAVTLQDGLGGQSRDTLRIVVVDLSSGAIVATIPRSAVGMGWNTAGDQYLFSRWHRPSSDDWTRETSVWDAGTWGSRTLPHEDAAPAWIDSRENFDLSNAQSRSKNSDATVLLSRAGDLYLSEEDGEPFASVPRFKDAAWSPVDAAVFATVGGDDAPSMVRIWRVQP